MQTLDLHTDRDLEEQIRLAITRSDWDVLERIGARDAVSLLTSKAFRRELHDGSTQNQKRLIQICGGIQLQGAALTILSVLEARNPEKLYREMIDGLVAIGKIGVPILIRALNRREASRLAVKVLGRLREVRAVDPLLKVPQVLAYSYGWERERYGEIIDALEAIGEIGVPTLIRAVNDSGKSESRDIAITALGRIRDTRAVEPLMRILTNCHSEPSSTIRTVAAALSRIGDPRAVAPLLTCLNIKGLQVDISEALLLLGESHHSLNTLLALLRDGEYDTRAIRLLGETGGRRAVDLILPALTFGQGQDPQMGANIREAAAEALGRLADRRAIIPLLEATWDKSAEVRAAVGGALKAFRPDYEESICLLSNDERHDWELDNTETTYEMDPVSKAHVVRDSTTYWYHCHKCRLKREEFVTSQWVE